MQARTMPWRFCQIRACRIAELRSVPLRMLSASVARLRSSRVRAHTTITGSTPSAWTPGPVAAPTFRTLERLVRDVAAYEITYDDALTGAEHLERTLPAPGSTGAGPDPQGIVRNTDEKM